MTHPTDTDSPRAALDRLQARRRAVLDELKGWPPGMIGNKVWQGKMRELGEINRELDRVFEGLEDRDDAGLHLPPPGLRP
jgi:hypothetical protein